MRLRKPGGSTNYTHRLGQIAAELEPMRAPWFVGSQFDKQTPSMGWWWIPHGAQHPAFLGHNHIVAEVELRQLIAAQELPRAL
jgi:hypothetical protein